MSYPEQTRPVAGGTPALIAQVALATALSGFVMGLFGVSIATSSVNVTAGILVRGLLALTVVLLVCRALSSRAVRAGLPSPVLIVTVGALIGYALDPLTWSARTALTQLVADPGVITLVGDLVLWLAVAALGAQVGSRSTPAPAPVATPYG